MPTTTKDATDLEKRIVAIVAEITGEAETSVTRDTRLAGDEAASIADSLDLIVIVMQVEDEYGIAVDEFERIGTVGDLIDLAAGKI